MEEIDRQNKIIINNREQLKKFFKKGMLPTENHFAILIDSMFNKAEDGINKNETDGLMVFPAGDEQKLLSFYDYIKDKKASWVIVSKTGESKGLIIKEDKNEWPTIFFEQGGKVGIGTLLPKQKLEVQGIIASQGRMGTFKEGNIPADGQWHDILVNLKGCNAFEIMALAGQKNKGKYALMHATAISTFGKSHSKISKTCAYYGFWWNRITCRWQGDTFEYKLQMKTWSNYGKEAKINYKISKLWDNSFNLEEG
ncbi:hypothetical protein P872_20185 [Rhodonellum psychrophilum GCM71 = DSM 17998]|uniref:Adhesin n=2 Tax=Rhodonellum TaxID=336827 RepID=U5BZ65_9BACT|nr:MULTISPECIES: hypothetical protein [Rhodonellum]ERM81207.1 hypothetical protein P872_20185 [Rhodonellum psychrophilum GCM71 = DSM 17998]MDO9554653.1 adhesin [Rhodonellum sp.]SDZ52453.1 hypothetical protein SAMN05444412_12025 [Rhodonellum ikkaensis]